MNHIQETLLKNGQEQKEDVHTILRPNAVPGCIQFGNPMLLENVQEVRMMCLHLKSQSSGSNENIFRLLQVFQNSPEPQLISV